MSNNPKLSIITINLNNNEGLEKTLQSLFNKQDNHDFESIVIDGESADGSIDTIKKYKEKISYWVSEPDKGIYHAMNKGILQANGEYLLFLNSGDYLADNILQSIYQYLGTTDIVYGNITATVQNKPILWTYPSKLSAAYLIQRSLGHPASFIKKDLFKGNLYDENYNIISDWIFFFKSIIMNNCTTRYVNINVCTFDTCGISSNEVKVKEEKERFLTSYFPPLLYEALIKYVAYDKFNLNDIILQIGKSHRYQKRIRPFILLSYKLNRLFSKH